MRGLNTAVFTSMSDNIQSFRAMADPYRDYISRALYVGTEFCITRGKTLRGMSPYVVSVAKHP